jgi:hypothetical protein
MCGPLHYVSKLKHQNCNKVVSINKVTKCHQSFQEFKNVNITIKMYDWNTYIWDLYNDPWKLNLKHNIIVSKN